MKSTLVPAVKLYPIYWPLTVLLKANLYMYPETPFELNALLLKYKNVPVAVILVPIPLITNEVVLYHIYSTGSFDVKFQKLRGVGTCDETL
jgi:hypothetical protein